MPEGPELRLASDFVNKIAKGRTFTGRVLKSEVSKNPNVQWDVDAYQINAESRGKEMKLWLRECADDMRKGDNLRRMSILFRFGMSGCFKYTCHDELPKHAHLRFSTKPTSEEGIYVLSFVDFRRFGKWEVDADWSKDRGPCPMFDYDNFRQNIIDNLDEPAFKNKPICEVMLNQKYFNGIGNYLRAEILYRAKIPPFAEASSSLAPWKSAPFYPVKKEDRTDIVDPLYLTHVIPKEVLQFGDDESGYNADRSACEVVDSAFDRWLRCYQNPLMSNLTDRNKRTIWFQGDAGPLVPPGSKSRRATPSKRLPTDQQEKPISKPKKVKKLEFSEQSVQIRKIYHTRSSTRQIQKAGNVD